MTRNDKRRNYHIDHLCDIGYHDIYFEREKKMIFSKKKADDNDQIIRLTKRISELERRINILEMRDIQRQNRELNKVDFSKKW